MSITRENDLERYLAIYRIPGPAVISFSGGRTSGKMLHDIAEAYNWQLPDDIKVAFCNTGKELEKTLRFVHECGSRWGIHIHWLEWRDTKPCYEEVGYNSAARSGEPFEALIRKKKRLPNWKERWCTEFLKVRPLFAFAESFGWKAGEYAEVVGLRYDEGHRILKGLDRAENSERKMAYPLSKAKIIRRDVMEFWAAQPFDLGLSSGEGNCDLCFMKGAKLRKYLMHAHPETAPWWIEQETRQNGFFRAHSRYQNLFAEAVAQTDLFDGLDEEHDVECGLLCPIEEPA